MLHRRHFIAAALAALPAHANAQAPREDFGVRLAIAARAQVGVTTRYDPAYVRLAYPNGDVARDRGVCTDVIIRAYRTLGFDLQTLVHEDMRAHFSAYPKTWGLTRPDRNIDHRRVPNLETFLRRRGARLSPSRNGADYQAGDLVSWRLNGSGLPHIGIVDPHCARENAHPLIIHNIGWGVRVEDILFQHRIVDRFRWRPQLG